MWSSFVNFVNRRYTRCFLSAFFPVFGFEQFYLMVLDFLEIAGSLTVNIVSFALHEQRGIIDCEGFLHIMDDD